MNEKITILLVVILILAGCRSFETIPTTGDCEPGMAFFDRAMLRLMEKWAIPGGSLAVIENGRVVLARGYGYADQGTGEPVQPGSLFRIASLSKPVTAAAVLALVEEGSLNLDTPVFQVLDDFHPPVGSDIDPRINAITIRHLLQHTGGWDSSLSFDPMFRARQIALEMGLPSPADCPTIITYMLGQPLDFDPGSRYAYANFGYCLLGRVVEAVSGQPYEAFVQARLLAPAGIETMRLGGTLPENRLPGEVRYYAEWEGLAESVFPGAASPIPWPYGGFYLEAMDAHGGWVASAVDLARFAWAIDPANPDAVLAPETLSLMTARPESPLWEGAESYYALGWRVRPSGKRLSWWHTGSLPGTTAVLYRTSSGMIWAALFNTRPESPGDEFLVDLISAMGWAALIGDLIWGAVLVIVVLFMLEAFVLIRRRMNSSFLKERNEYGYTEKLG